MKDVVAGLLFLPLALFFWGFVTLLFATSLAASAAFLWIDDVFGRLRGRCTWPVRAPAACCLVTAKKKP